MKYNKIQNQVFDMTDIFKKSELSNQQMEPQTYSAWPKIIMPESVQTEVN